MTKILVTGYGRHGKDTMCEMLNMTFTSSSYFAMSRAVWPKWGKHIYSTMDECFDDRHSGDNRAEWYRLIKEYNMLDKSRLAQELLANNDIYCGMRCAEELTACKEAGLFDLLIWVDASERLPAESNSSMTITKDMCDIVIENNGTLEEFEKKVERFKRFIKSHSRFNY